MPEPVGFWPGTFTGKVDRAIARAALRPLLMEEATRDEVEAMLSRAAEGLVLAPPDGVRRMRARRPDIFQVFREEPSGPAVGLFAYMPLNAYGARAIAEGIFSGLAPDPAVIAVTPQETTAFYFWLVYAPNNLHRALARIGPFLRAQVPEGCPIFSRAATRHSENLQRSIGFVTARGVLPNAPEWLLLALPTGVASPAISSLAEPTAAVAIVRTMEEMAAIYAVRSSTFIAEQFCLYDEEFDGNDFCSTQFLARVDSDPAGCIRLRYFGDFAKLERLCVRREYRGMRLPELIIGKALDHARAKGFRRVYGHSRQDLVGFWRGFGFEPIEGRPAFSFANIPYVEIVADLPADELAITFGADPMMTIRPEGEWDVPGPFDWSLLDTDPLRQELIRKHARLRT